VQRGTISQLALGGIMPGVADVPMPMPGIPIAVRSIIIELVMVQTSFR